MDKNAERRGQVNTIGNSVKGRVWEGSLKLLICRALFNSEKTLYDGAKLSLRDICIKIDVPRRSFKIVSVRWNVIRLTDRTLNFSFVNNLADMSS